MKPTQQQINAKMSHLRFMKMLKHIKPKKQYTATGHYAQTQTQQYTQPTELSTYTIEEYKNALRKKLLNVDSEKFLLH